MHNLLDLNIYSIYNSPPFPPQMPQHKMQKLNIIYWGKHIFHWISLKEKFPWLTRDPNSCSISKGCIIRKKLEMRIWNKQWTLILYRKHTLTSIRTLQSCNLNPRRDKEVRLGQLFTSSEQVCVFKLSSLPDNWKEISSNIKSPRRKIIAEKTTYLF